MFFMLAPASKRRKGRAAARAFPQGKEILNAITKIHFSAVPEFNRGAWTNREALSCMTPAAQAGRILATAAMRRSRRPAAASTLAGGLSAPLQRGSRGRIFALPIGAVTPLSKHIRLRLRPSAGTTTRAGRQSQSHTQTGSRSRIIIKIAVSG
jgi:hypothetical protein